MATNVKLTADIILREAKRLFKNNCPLLAGFNKTYDDSYSAYGAKSGDTIRIKKPQLAQTRTTKQMQVKAYEERSVSLARSNWLGSDLKFSNAELALDLPTFSKEILSPHMHKMACDLESSIFGLINKQVTNQVGTAGTDPASVANLLLPKTRLDLLGSPGTNRSLILGPAGEAASVAALSGLFQSSEHIRDQYIKGKMGTALGYDFAMSQQVNRHTRGTADANYTVNGASQSGASLIVADGTGTILQGDIFTIAGVNSVNRVTKQSTGQLQQFTVTADYAGGAGTLAITPSIELTGPYQNVTALPADDAAITVVGTSGTDYAIHLAHDQEAFAFGSADIELPKNAEFAARNTEDNISMSIVRDYDIQNNDTYCRIDLLWGFVVVSPEMACRYIGA